MINELSSTLEKAKHLVASIEFSSRQTMGNKERRRVVLRKQNGLTRACQRQDSGAGPDAVLDQGC